MEKTKIEELAEIVRKDVAAELKITEETFGREISDIVTNLIEGLQMTIQLYSKLSGINMSALSRAFMETLIRIEMRANKFARVVAGEEDHAKN